MIYFNVPAYVGKEDDYIIESVRSGKISGDGMFTKKCHLWFEKELGCEKALLTTSCTHALEMAAILIDIQPGDEVIMPSYTFVSTANAFVLRGAKIVFVDIRPDTLNIDETKIEAAVTAKTRAIVPVHYAGVGCEMDTIMEIARRHDLYVVEDAAQGMKAKYKGRALGTIGHLGAFSFHETKNYSAGGEGGLLIINDEQFSERAEIIREKGTNRSQFFRGMVDKYTWVDLGSSYLPADINAAYLYAQLEAADAINEDRLKSWHHYYQALRCLEAKGVQLPSVPETCQHNAHMFYLKCSSHEERTAFLEHCKENGILAVFHYVPLHTSPAGRKFSRFEGTDSYTTAESERLVRLPLYYAMGDEVRQKVIDTVKGFYGFRNL